ncbi:hypothetical protein [Mycobacterium sp. DL592]|uniref:hypothetical protein n=1 Tax=Mycobacterium sp. DL592 TaxID=2675524 RepID=UPI00141D849A|nr:hypothetical protein [Mycobacterium sp. DL592]
MTACEFLVDGEECRHPAVIRVVRAAAEGGTYTVAVCTLHAPDVLPIVTWEPIRGGR